MNYVHSYRAEARRASRPKTRGMQPRQGVGRPSQRKLKTARFAQRITNPLYCFPWHGRWAKTASEVQKAPWTGQAPPGGGKRRRVTCRALRSSSCASPRTPSRSGDVAFTRSFPNQISVCDFMAVQRPRPEKCGDTLSLRRAHVIQRLL